MSVTGIRLFLTSTSQENGQKKFIESIKSYALRVTYIRSLTKELRSLYINCNYWVFVEHIYAHCMGRRTDPQGRSIGLQS